MRTYTKKTETITKTSGWFTASFNVAAGIISKDFRTRQQAFDFLQKQ